MKVKFYDHFWSDPGVPRSRVFEILPDVHADGRGFFVEVARRAQGPLPADEWYRDLSWIAQVNRSSSSPGVARGMHAQTGGSCQGKLVQAVCGRVYDVIVDARPDSKTFGVADVFELDSKRQNQLWVPRGFLHGFVVPPDLDGQAVFEYFCDNVYDKAAEVSVAPGPVIRKVFEAKTSLVPSFATDVSALRLSEKDEAGFDYERWMEERLAEYGADGSVWYRKDCAEYGRWMKKNFPKGGDDAAPDAVK